MKRFTNPFKDMNKENVAGVQRFDSRKLGELGLRVPNGSRVLHFVPTSVTLFFLQCFGRHQSINLVLSVSATAIPSSGDNEVPFPVWLAMLRRVPGDYETNIQKAMNSWANTHPQVKNSPSAAPALMGTSKNSAVLSRGLNIKGSVQDLGRQSTKARRVALDSYLRLLYSTEEDLDEDMQSSQDTASPATPSVFNFSPPGS
jgi:hypothetical protein